MKTRVLLISPNRENRPAVFPLGMAYVNAALRRKGVVSGMADFLHIPFCQESITDLLNRFQPDYIGISLRNVDNCCMRFPRGFVQDACVLMSWLRAWSGKTPIILGGSGFSLFPEEWLCRTGADWGVVGDGVRAIPMLIRKLLTQHSWKHVPGLCWLDGARTFHQNRSDPEKEPAETVFPDRAGFLHQLDPTVHVLHNVRTKLGCSLHCTYCAYPQLEGRKYRLRSPQKVAQEILSAKIKYGIMRFDFVDSVFNLPRQHALEVCRAVRSTAPGVQWGCFMNPVQEGLDRELLETAQQAGCVHIEFGVDSASVPCLNCLGKQFGPDDVKRAVLLCEEVGIDYNVCLLIGCGAETEETLRETLDLLEQAGVKDVFGLLGVRILPHTPVHHQIFGEKLPDLLEPTFDFSKQLPVERAMEILSSFQACHAAWQFL